MCNPTDAPNSWFQVDLGEGKLFTTNYYCLRSRTDHDVFHPTNWRLEGSNTGKDGDWTNLRTHTNDTNIYGLGKEFGWSLPDNNSTAVASYRYFRLFQFGENSDGTNEFNLSAFELYGTLTITRNTNAV